MLRRRGQRPTASPGATLTDASQRAALRVWLIGAPGAGKTVLARALSQRFELPVHHLDDYFWGPGWSVTPPERFEQQVGAAIAGDSWIVDGQYTRAAPLLQARANVLVWLHLPLALSYFRICRRTWSRLVSGQLVCNGNRETLGRVFLRSDSLLIYALAQHRRNLRRMAGHWSSFSGARLELTDSTQLVERCVAWLVAMRSGNGDQGEPHPAAAGDDPEPAR
jgi:chloramphenicol 3-O-phosphotransferase